MVRISEDVGYNLFPFETMFLKKFSLSWRITCQRLYQVHVFRKLTDTLVICFMAVRNTNGIPIFHETLRNFTNFSISIQSLKVKNEEATPENNNVMKRYLTLCDTMFFVELRWTHVWHEMNKFNLSITEVNRRKAMAGIHCIFAKMTEDANSFDLTDDFRDEKFIPFRTIKNYDYIWQKIMFCVKSRWPNGFFPPKNNKVVAERCNLCNGLVEYHLE